MRPLPLVAALGIALVATPALAETLENNRANDPVAESAVNLRANEPNTPDTPATSAEPDAALQVSDVAEPHALTLTPADVAQTYTPGWVWQDGAWCWRTASGSFAIGWRLVDGVWYYLGEDGAMRTGWQYIGRTWYHFASSGAMGLGWQYIDGAWYYLGDDGAMRTGWYWADSAWHYASTSGEMRRWWLLDGNYWYYLGADGSMHTGWTFIDDAWYYFNGSGAMQTGWFVAGDDWYHSRPGGQMQTGWQYIDGQWYYLGEDGPMARGTTYIDDIPFYFSIAGNLVNANTRTYDATGTSLAEMAALNWVDESCVELGGPESGGILQFKDISDPNPEGVTADQVNDYIARNCKWAESYYGCTSSMRGMGKEFIDAAYWYGVNVVYLVSHAAIESAWGCSSLSRGEFWTDPENAQDKGGHYYNYFGYGAYDSNPYNGGMRYAQQQGWTTPGAGIWGGAKSISNNWIHATATTPQITTYELRWDPKYTAATGRASYHQYATDDEFARGIGSQMGWFYALEDVEPVLDLVIPVYGD